MKILKMNSETTKNQFALLFWNNEFTIVFFDIPS